MTPKKNFSAFLFVLLFVSSAFAQTTKPFDYDPDIAKEAAKHENSQLGILRSASSYMWLYKLIMPADLQVSNPNETTKSFEVHLQDSYSAFPTPADILDAKLKPAGITRHGSITYVGIWPMNYSYDVLEGANNKRIIRVKVHFKNPRGTDIQDFTDKVKQAETIWNMSRPPMDFVYKFYFEVVTDPKLAHYSVNIEDSTRGPYSVNWGRNWDARTIAHEMGHMMGIGDEYETLSGDTHCLVQSIMCDNNRGVLMPHHYYFILRRLI